MLSSAAQLPMLFQSVSWRSPALSWYNTIKKRPVYFLRFQYNERIFFGVEQNILF